MKIKPEVSQVRLKSYSEFKIATGASKLASRGPLGGGRKGEGWPACRRGVAGVWPACGRHVAGEDRTTAKIPPVHTLLIQ